jgi:hemerythrin-like domain-containing protein
VLALKDPALTAVVHLLQRDHVDMEAAWSHVREALQTLTVSGARLPPDWCDHTRDLVQHFVSLYERHIPEEEQCVYPAGERAIEPDALTAMAQDMMQRRGVQLA